MPNLRLSWLPHDFGIRKNQGKMYMMLKLRNTCMVESEMHAMSMKLI
jgi:hypothetical protein